MADTALTIITDALLDLGVLAEDETPSASQVQGGLRKLNNMIDSWNISNLMVYGATPITLPLVANQGSYTIGLGGDLNIPRPANITAAFIRDVTQAGNSRQDIPVYMFNNEEWQNVAFKGQTGTYPYQGIWVNETSPLLTVHVTPIPTGSIYQLVLWVSDMISNLTQNDVITLAPGYKRALTANLAVEWAGSFQVEVPASVAVIASSSKAQLKAKNLQINELRLPWVTGGYGYYGAAYPGGGGVAVGPGGDNFYFVDNDDFMFVG